MDDLKQAAQQALEALTWCEPEGAVVTAARSAAIEALRAALAQEEQKEQDARAEQIMSEIWAQPDQTYEYIGAKLAENMQKSMKNRARVSVEAVRSALEQEEQEPPREPSVDQLDQIIDGLARCHVRESSREFLRTWIRDWTTHKLTQQEEEELVTRRSALAALNHLSLHNGPGRLEEATKMLVNPPRREWQGLTEQRDELLAALRLIAATDPVDAALDPQRAVRVARAAIAKAEWAK